MTTSIEFGLEHPEIKDELKEKVFHRDDLLSHPF